ncbi:hypothetical protein UFOVP38_11 [uncultured Caudovirales phage]|uniref:Large polyvalent protein associated domain-containing protein n=1 Tax=uncultured Caudovirales phage TaxID=2100421 RepID=A0A6J5T7E8_9CAUD|nr:hypothetical protein UFOVP38_11 [uncultured Caudovirales phage]
MATFGQDDEVVSKPAAAPVAAKSSWGQGDEVVKQPVVGSRWHNIGRTAVETAPSAAAGLAGFGAGMAAVAPVAAGAGALSGPFAPVTAGVIELAGGLGGALVASGAAQAVTDMMHKAFAPDDYKQRQIEKQQRPYGTFAAATLANLAGMSPKTAPEVAGKLLSKPIVQRGTSAALTGSIEAGSQLASDGKIDPIKVAGSAAAGAVMPGFNPAGKKLFEAGQAVGNKVSGAASTKPATDKPSSDLPPKPTQSSTPEEKAAFVKRMDEIKAQRDSVAPLEQAAIRNTETGNIELMGPKHDQARKDAIKGDPTYEEGFVDSRGNFHERQAAVDQAKRSGQLPQDHVLESPDGERPGLHSGDLRKVGDPRFAVTEDQPAGVPKPPSTEPITRAEHFKNVADLEFKLYLEEGKVEADGHLLSPEELTAKNKELDALRTEIADARKNAPEAVVADKRNLTNVELHEVLAGSKTVGEGLQALIDGGYGSKGQRWLAKKLNSFKVVTDTTLQLDYNNRLRPPEGSVKGKEWLGLYDPASREVHLYEPANVATLLHEAVHAASLDFLRAGTSKAAKQIVALYEHVKSVTPQDVWESHYGSTNPEEFLSEAYTDTRFVNFLKKTPGLKDVESGNAWAGFKRIIENYFGASDKATVTALDQVLEHGSRLMDMNRTTKADVTSSKVAASSNNKQEVLYHSSSSKIDFSNPDKPIYLSSSEGYSKRFDPQGTGETKAYTANLTNPYRTNVHGEIDGLTTSVINDLKAQGYDGVIFEGTGGPSQTLVFSAKSLTEMPAKKFGPVDAPQTNPRDVKSLEEFEQIAADIYEKHGEVEAVKFYEGYKEYQKTWLEPIAETEKFVGINLRNKAANERIIHNDMADMRNAVPDPARREAIAEAVDSGDLSSLNLEERAVAQKYSDLVRNIGERAVEKGVVKGLLEDYVTHIIDWAGAPKGAREELINALFGKGSSGNMAGMTTESKFGKSRSFKTFADLQGFIDEANARIAAAGKSDFRLQIKTKDIAEIYKEYATSMEKAIENKNLVENLKQVRNVLGETLIREVTKDSPMPPGWKMMDTPQFAGEAAHPDLEPALKFVFDAGPKDLMKALGMISQVTKRMNVIGSFFHAKSMMEVMSSAQIPLWTPIKEALVLPLVEKAVKGLTGKELQLSAISKAVEQYRKGGVGENVDKWIREAGLQLEVPEDVSQGVLSSLGKFGDSMIGKYGPKTRVLEKSLSTVEKYTLGLFDKYTWDYLHTGGKIMVADAYLDKARIAAAKEGKPFDETQQRKEIAKFVNNSFGGLNWFDAATQTQNEFAKRMAMAAYSPEGRRGLQVALFAPDWTLSTLRAFTDALPKSLNPTKWHPVEGVKGMMTPTTSSDYARLYQFKTALTYLTVINAINMMTANRPVWENKDPSRIEWPDGTSMQAMKHAMEPYHWIADPDKTFASKLGFIPKALWVGMAGTEYASPQAQKIVPDKMTGNATVDNYLSRAKVIAQSALPFQAQAAAGAPQGEGVKRALLGTAGFPMYGSTAEQKKVARAERELRTKENAWEYRDKEIQAGRKEWTSKHAREQKTLERERKKLELNKAKQQ